MIALSTDAYADEAAITIKMQRYIILSIDIEVAGRKKRF